MSVPIPDGVQMSILLRGSSFEVVPCRYARSFARNGGLLDSLHLSNLGDETYSISMSLPKVPVEGQPLGVSNTIMKNILAHCPYVCREWYKSCSQNCEDVHCEMVFNILHRSKPSQSALVQTSHLLFGTKVIQPEEAMEYIYSRLRFMNRQYADNQSLFTELCIHNNLMMDINPVMRRPQRPDTRVSKFICWMQFCAGCGCFETTRTCESCSNVRLCDSVDCEASHRCCKFNVPPPTSSHWLFDPNALFCERPNCEREVTITCSSLCYKGYCSPDCKELDDVIHKHFCVYTISESFLAPVIYQKRLFNRNQEELAMGRLSESELKTYIKQRKNKIKKQRYLANHGAPSKVECYLCLMKTKPLMVAPCVTAHAEFVHAECWKAQLLHSVICPLCRATIPESMRL